MGFMPLITIQECQNNVLYVHTNQYFFAFAQSQRIFRDQH